jgi:hypothetical protein
MESASPSSLTFHGHRRTDSAAPWGTSHFLAAWIRLKTLRFGRSEVAFTVRRSGGA